MIELIVAMVIVAILASIAIPSYSSYVRKGRRVDAKTAVLDLASLEERYYSTSNKYSNTATDLGYPAGASFDPPGVVVGSSYYQVTIPTVTLIAPAPGTPASYKITATAINDQANDTSCFSYSVTSTGLRTAATSAGVDNTANCW